MGLTPEGRYRYTQSLLSLERAHELHPSDRAPHPGPSRCVSFLPIERWDFYLSCHPDQEFAEFLRRGITYGFRIGFNRATSLRPMSGNLSSVSQHPAVVDKYIQAEVASHKLLLATPIDAQTGNLETVHRSPIGIIPKPHQPGKFRLIVDLSSPHGYSVNEGVKSQFCSLEYTSVDTAALLVRQHGKGALMAKLDLKSAYRMVPVHKDDQHLLGITWNGVTYIDQALPFGLRSAPIIFTAIADGLAWAMLKEGISEVVHYLDDFFFCGPASSSACETALNTAVPLCERLGFPVAPDKVVGPSTTLTFLGIELDTIKQELRLPAEKLSRLKKLINNWNRKNNTSKRELQCLMGHLSFACTVVRPGRMFTHSLFALLKLPKHPSHRVRLNAQCKADIAWWQLFLPAWNGSGFLNHDRGSLQVFSDASGSWGCAAINTLTGQWFQLEWPQSWKSVNIAIKEFIPVVISAAVWGSTWQESTICFNIDNQAVVAALGRSRAKDPHLAHLLRCMFFFEAHFKFQHKAEHVPGAQNVAADALSRNKVTLFHSVFPQAQPNPTQVPQQLTSLLMDPGLTWTSDHWKRLFNDILSMV